MLCCVCCLVTLTLFSTCGSDHICIQQTELAAITWASRQRAHHTRSELGCLFLRAVSPWTSRETMTQIMREMVKLSFMWRIRALCSSAPYDKVYALHGIVNTFPARNHALSHAIFHLRVVGRDLWKHLMKVLTWRSKFRGRAQLSNTVDIGFTFFHSQLIHRFHVGGLRLWRTARYVSQAHLVLCPLLANILVT